jgi:hypothetical protein
MNEQGEFDNQVTIIRNKDEPTLTISESSKVSSFLPLQSHPMQANWQFWYYQR